MVNCGQLSGEKGAERGKIRGDLGCTSVWGEVGDKLVNWGDYKSGGA